MDGEITKLELYAIIESATSETERHGLAGTLTTALELLQDGDHLNVKRLEALERKNLPEWDSDKRRFSGLLTNLAEAAVAEYIETVKSAEAIFDEESLDRLQRVHAVADALWQSLELTWPAVSL